MSFGSHGGSRGNSGAKFQKQETAELTLKEIAEKTVASIERLGNQTFALSPFSQYYDDWLVNLRQVVAEFEASPKVKADEAFTKEREQAFLDIQAALAEKRLQENNL